MNDNVVQFPGSKHMVSQGAKGKKVTQEAALTALIEMRKMFEGLMNNMGRLSQAHIGLENILQRLDTNFGILMRVLLDKKVFLEEDWNTAWDKFVVQPQQEALTKLVDDLDAKGGEDRMYANVIRQVRTFDFPEREHNGEKVPGTAVRDFYIQMLVQAQTRGSALEDLKTIIPDLMAVVEPAAVEPEPLLEQPVEEPSLPLPEERKMPDCRYCGKPECAFCSTASVEEKSEV